MATRALQWPRHPSRFLSDREEISTGPAPQSVAALSPKLERWPRKSTKIKVTGAIGGVEQAIDFTIDDGSQIPGWLTPNLKRAVPLLFLEPNWDCEGGTRIERSSIISAINALTELMQEDSSIPQWLPTSAGGVQLEWHEAGIDLEIEFSPDGSESTVVFADLNCPTRDWDGPLKDNIQALVPVFINRLQRAG